MIKEFHHVVNPDSKVFDEKVQAIVGKLQNKGYKVDIQYSLAIDNGVAIYAAFITGRSEQCITRSIVRNVAK